MEYIAEELVQELAYAKKAEDAARERRLKAEEDLVKLLGNKQEGSETHYIFPYEVTITGKLTRKLDSGWEDIMARIPDGMRPVRTKAEIDLSRLRYLESNEPDIYRVACQAITTKPAKVAVTIKGV